MSAPPVALEAAKAWLRVTQDAEDGLIADLLAASQARVERALGVTLDDASPGPLRLAVMMLVAHAFEHRGDSADLPPLALVEPWLAPFRRLRL